MSVIDMSVIAVPLIAAIVAIRFFAVYKLPKKTFYIMWGIVLYQLLIPLNLFKRLNVFGYITALGVKLKEVFIKSPEITDILSNVGNPINTVDKFVTDLMTRTAESAVNPTHFNISSLMLVLLAGLICFTAYFIVTHIRFRRIYAEALPVDSKFVRDWRVEYSDSIRRKVKIRQSDLINSPLTYGIFRPVILLPKITDYNDETTLRYILIHEYTHIRRFDALIKLLLVTTLCVHWFNPFAWIMYVLANRDIELSCDETVVKKFNVNLKSEYALTLIALEEKNSLLALGVNFSGNLMKERIKAIMKIKKRSVSGIISAIILVFIVTVMFAASQSCKNDIDSADAIIEAQEVQELNAEPESYENVDASEEEAIPEANEETLAEITDDLKIYESIVWNNGNLLVLNKGEVDFNCDGVVLIESDVSKSFYNAELYMIDSVYGNGDK